jgi:hypothetical protein
VADSDTGTWLETMDKAKGREFQGEVVIQERDRAEAVARKWGDEEDTAWTDGSRLKDGKVGAAVTWREADFQQKDRRWSGTGYYLRRY